MKTLVLSLFIVLTSFAQLTANSSGVARRSVLTSAGCGPSGCHGASQNANTSVSIEDLAAGADLQVVVGQALTFNVRVAHPTAAASGVNISVKTELNGSTNAGSFAMQPGSNLKLQSGELVHSSPKNFAGGTVSFPVRWTAPTEAGTYYLHVIANAVNRNGGPDMGDQWNWMQPVRIVVSEASSVMNEQRIATATLDLRPIPAHGDVMMTLPNDAADEEYEMLVVDAHGTVLFRRENASAQQGVISWDGTTSAGTHAAPGSYVVALRNERRILRGRAIIIR